MPTTVLSDALEKRPVLALAAYASLLVVLMYFAVALTLSWTKGYSGGDDGSDSVMSGDVASDVVGIGSSASTAANALRFYISGGTRQAAAAIAAAAANEGSGNVGGGNVASCAFRDGSGMIKAGGGAPSLVVWIVLPVALMAGLAPAVAFAVGFKRRTDAFWRRWV